MVRPTLIHDMNLNELKYYPFMISLIKCTGRCNVLSPKMCVPKETKDIYVKAFDIITNKDEAKAITEHIQCDCKFKSNSKTKKQKKRQQQKDRYYSNKKTSTSSINLNNKKS